MRIAGIVGIAVPLAFLLLSQSGSPVYTSSAQARSFSCATRGPCRGEAVRPAQKQQKKKRKKKNKLKQQKSGNARNNE